MSSIREGEKRASLPRKEHSNSVNRKCNSHWATSTLRSAVPEGRDLGKVSRAKVELRLGTRSGYPPRISRRPARARAWRIDSWVPMRLSRRWDHPIGYESPMAGGRTTCSTPSYYVLMPITLCRVNLGVPPRQSISMGVMSMPWTIFSNQGTIMEGFNIRWNGRMWIGMKLLNEGTKANDAYGKSFRARRRGVLRPLLFLLYLTQGNARSTRSSSR